MSGKINKVIFFVEHPFGQRDYDRLGIELIQKNGFQVEVWDFTPFLHPNVYEQVIVPDPIKYERYRCFFLKIDALHEIAKLHEDVFIIFFMGYYPRAFSLYRAVSKNNLKYAVFMANSLPLPYEKKKSFKSILRRLKNFTTIKLYNHLFLKTPPILLGLKSARFCLASGEKSTHSFYPIDKDSETLWIHTLDYDLYLAEKDKNIENVTSNIAVFLDEYIPFHPDNIHRNFLPPSSEEYYPLLCDFFDFLEKKYAVKVVIAAHPRANYNEHPDFYRGREVIQYRTIKLVKKCAFVILHASTSINFAILFKKPCIFITTNKIQGGYMGPYINKLASLFGTSPINLDHKLDDWQVSPTIDLTAYNNYKNEYIKRNDTGDLPFWQIFSNHINKMH